MRKNNSIKISNIIISLLFILIGAMEAYSGAAEDSRFYFYDNIFIRIIGVLFVITSIGLLFKNLLARKAMIFLCSISILEVLITFDYTYTLLETVITLLISGILYAAPIMFLLLPRVKNYYISKGRSENSETFLSYQGEYAQRKHSKLGISSFIAAIASILLFVFGFNIGDIPYDTGASLEEMLRSSPNLFIAGLFYILGFVISLVGFGLGIAGIFTRNKRKVYAIWGTVINGIISTILILAFVLAASYLKDTTTTFVNKAIISCFNKM